MLLGYLWLSTFSPQIDWKTGQVEGEVTLKTVASAWVQWKELRKAALVAGIQVNQVKVEEEERGDEEWEVMVAKTNFVQDWCHDMFLVQLKDDFFLCFLVSLTLYDTKVTKHDTRNLM